MTIDLSLNTRSGIPDDLAYLRALHPKEGWQAHASYGQLADFWLKVHGSLRRYGGDVQQTTLAFRDGRIDAADFQRAFVRRFNQFLHHLNGHHQIEDSAYFPKFRALDPRMIAGFDLLENDHELIHDRLSASVDSARTLLAALQGPNDTLRSAADAHAQHSDVLLTLLIRHLTDEEDLVIPAMLEHGERSVS